MYGNRKSGFSLIELLVVIAIIAAMATILVPRLGRKPKYERETFIRNLNQLSTFASQQAIIKNKKIKLLFDFTKRTIQVQEATDKKDEKGEPMFATIKGAYVQSTTSWPKTIEIKNFYIEGFDEMSRFVGGNATEVWYFVMPSGRSQAVIINANDTKDRIGPKVRPFSLVLNPFSSVFKEYDSFQK